MLQSAFRSSAAGPPVAAALDAAPGPAETIGRRALMAAFGLSIAAVAAPLIAIALPGLGPLTRLPLAARALMLLLLLAPAAVGLATALSGLGRVLRSFAEPDHEPEQAVLRIFVAAAMYGYATAIGPDRTTSLSVPIAVFGLVAGWALLLHIVLRPAASTWRRRGAMAFDIALVSAFVASGGADTAGWYPLYLLASVYAGLRFGSAALRGTTALSLLGFAGVVASTPYWQQQPALAAGLMLALLALPALVAGAIAAIAEWRATAAAADFAKARFIAVVTSALRAPMATLRNALSAADGVGPDPALLSQISDLLDLAAIEAGTFVPQTEAFDLHAAVNDAVAAARYVAAKKGLAFRLRMDPRLPFRLRGSRPAVERILRNLLSEAILSTASGAVRIVLSTLASDESRVQFSLTIDCAADRKPAAATMADPFGVDGAGADPGGLGLAVVKRIAERIGGHFSIDATSSGRTRYAVELSLAIDPAASPAELDLARHPVLIVTADSQFAGDLAHPIGAWNGDARWIGEAEAALDYIARLDSTRRPVLLVDARDKPLSAVSFVNRALALALGGAAPFVLFVTEESHIAGLAELDDGDFDALLPSPPKLQVLLNALHALPLQSLAVPRAEPASPLAQLAASAISPAAAAETLGSSDGRVTPIAAHPRFATDPAPAIDTQMIEALRELGGDNGFLRDIIETFRADAQQIMRRLGQAVAAGDAAAFAHGLRALHQSAAHVGGSQLCQLMVTLRGLNAGELREQGSLHLQRLGAETDRLAAGLLDCLSEAEARGA